MNFLSQSSCVSFFFSLVTITFFGGCGTDTTELEKIKGELASLRDENRELRMDLSKFNKAFNKANSKLLNKIDNLDIPTSNNLELEELIKKIESLENKITTISKNNKSSKKNTGIIEGNEIVLRDKNGIEWFRVINHRFFGPVLILGQTRVPNSKKLAKRAIFIPGKLKNNIGLYSPSLFWDIDSSKKTRLPQDR